MPNKSLSRSSLTTFEKYSSMLAGNTAFDPSSDFLLEEIVLSSSAASVTFSGLGSYSDYKHLQIRWVARSNRSSDDNMITQFNGDTSTAYRTHELLGYGSGIISQDYGAATRITSGSLGGTNVTANAFSAGVMEVLDFQNSSKNTTIKQLDFGMQSVTGISLRSGLWVNTSAVTSISFAPLFGSGLVAGSRFSLYGSKG